MTFLVKTRASVNDGWRWWDVMTMTIRADKQEKKVRKGTGVKTCQEKNGGGKRKSYKVVANLRLSNSKE